MIGSEFFGAFSPQNRQLRLAGRLSCDRSMQKPRAVYLRLLRNSPIVLLGLLSGYLGYSTLIAIFNPTDRNHLLIIDQSGALPESECLATLEGEVTWQLPVPHILRGRPGEPAVTTINISRAWFSGKFRIKNRNDDIISETEIRPPGRYCGTLVVTLEAGQQSHSAFNEIPQAPEE
jgi:hypothetical protein